MKWIALAALACRLSAQSIPDGDWPNYGRDPGGTKYSTLRGINRDNVANLKLAWTYRTGDLLDRKNSGRAQPAHEATPLFVDETLYLGTPFGRVIALDPESGGAKWTFDPHIDIQADYSDYVNRGVSTWVDPRRSAREPCRRRIFIGTIDARLIALDSVTGKPCLDFGKNGEIRLVDGLRTRPEYVGEYEVTSPPAIYGDLVIVGSGVADNNRVHAPSGEVRAFDARTGKLRWTWYPLPDDPKGPGAANAWSAISVDAERKLVFVPTGSASPDYYGGLRPGDGRYANSLVALNAETGKLAWAFQTVHHDLWDYDSPSQPVLMTIRQGSELIPAVAAGSKTGHLFILRRDNGKPVFGVDERAVPASDVPGETASKTQPFPVLPKALVPQKLMPEDAWGINEEDRKWCADKIRSLRSEGIFTPPSLGGTLVIPGNIGGMQWGGATLDPARSLLFIPNNRIAAVVRLIPHAQFDREKKAHPELQTTEQKGAPYSMSRAFLLNPHGLPCNTPPWGAMTAIDLNTGQVRWEVPIGSQPALAGNPHAEEWGSTGMGGALSTASGLLFFAGTLDGNFRALDSETGRELWRAKLPTAARATPMTFRTQSGKQLVVIVAGGRNATTAPQGDYVLAFEVK